MKLLLVELFGIIYQQPVTSIPHCLQQYRVWAPWGHPVPCLRRSTQPLGPIFSWGLLQCLCCVGPRADNRARARPPQKLKPPAMFPVVLLLGKEFFHHPLHGFVLTAMCPQHLRAEPVPRSWSCGGLKLHLRMESHRLGPARWEG